jgi:hypothetical protein
MKLWLAKRRRDDKVGLVPTDDASRAALGRLGDGECVEVEIIRPRSLQWHRMYFGICRAIGENQDPTRDEGSIDHELRVRAGHYDLMWIDGHECRVPKRIAFARLTADEWAELWPSLDLAIREHFGEEYIDGLARTGTW